MPDLASLSEGVRHHFYIRPHWNCGACRDPWPCDPAKEFLLTEYVGRRAELTVFLGICVIDMVLDFAGDGSVTRENVGVRFLGWIAPLLPAPSRSESKPTGGSSSDPFSWDFTGA